MSYILNEISKCQHIFACIHLYFKPLSYIFKCYIINLDLSEVFFLFVFSLISFAWRSSFSTAYIHVVSDLLTMISNHLLIAIFSFFFSIKYSGFWLHLHHFLLLLLFFFTVLLTSLRRILHFSLL